MCILSSYFVLGDSYGSRLFGGWDKLPGGYHVQRIRWRSLGTYLLRHRQASARKWESLNETHDNDLVPVRDSTAVIKMGPSLSAALFLQD